MCAHCGAVGTEIDKDPLKHLQEVADFLGDAAAKLGAMGGIASAKALTPAQRSARAKKAVDAREAKRRKI